MTFLQANTFWIAFICNYLVLNLLCYVWSDDVRALFKKDPCLGILAFTVVSMVSFGMWYFAINTLNKT